MSGNERSKARRRKREQERDRQIERESGRKRDGRKRETATDAGRGTSRRITETEREIDVEGLSTTDKYYIRASRRRGRERGGVGAQHSTYTRAATVSLIF